MTKRTRALVLEPDTLPLDYEGAEWLRVTLTGDPITKQRARAQTKGGLMHFYTPEKTRAGTATVAGQLKAAMRGRQPNAWHDLAVAVEFHCATRQRRDIDNLLKLIFDAANGIAWKDDSQVVELTARMVRSATEPRTEVVIALRTDRSLACAQCRARFVPRTRGGRYCSRECASAAQRRGVTVRCATCSAAVYRKSEKLTAYPNHYCSTACKSEAQAGRPHQVTRLRAPDYAHTQTCPVCGKEYRGRAKTCSMRCGVVRRELGLQTRQPRVQVEAR